MMLNLGCRSQVALDCRCRRSQSLGDMFPDVEYLRRRLQDASIQSAMAAVSSVRVAHLARSGSSIWVIPQNDSTTALSYASPTVPIVGTSPAEPTL